MNRSANVEGRSTVSVGVVVPTLGARPHYLRESLRSIRAAGSCFIVVVRPKDTSLGSDVESTIDHVVDDPGVGLAAAINSGIGALPRSVLYATWLGDDDRLTPGSLATTLSEIEETSAVAVFGQCRYIDAEGTEVWLNRSGRWAPSLMLFGPQLVPQPGSLFRRSAFEAIGGLNEDLKWAFDLDMFLKLKKQPGGLRFINAPLAEFRWHPDSLTVGSRRGSVIEASQVRQRHLPGPLHSMSRLWEPLLRWGIFHAGSRLSDKLIRMST